MQLILTQNDFDFNHKSYEFNLDFPFDHQPDHYEIATHTQGDFEFHVMRQHHEDGFSTSAVVETSSYEHKTKNQVEEEYTEHLHEKILDALDALSESLSTLPTYDQALASIKDYHPAPAFLTSLKDTIEEAKEVGATGMTSNYHCGILSIEIFDEDDDNGYYVDIEIETEFDLDQDESIMCSKEWFECFPDHGFLVDGSSGSLWMHFDSDDYHPYLGSGYEGQEKIDHFIECLAYYSRLYRGEVYFYGYSWVTIYKGKQVGDVGSCWGFEDDGSGSFDHAFADYIKPHFESDMKDATKDELMFSPDQVVLNKFKQFKLA